jgi:aspartate kinase
MTDKIGVAATLFNALADNSINVRIIDQGSSQINIIIGVSESETERAIQSIYKAFIN